MERREFIKIVCGVVGTWPLAAQAQQPGNQRLIGVLGADATAWGPWTVALTARLRELGWSDGDTVAIEYRWAQGRSDRISEFAAEFERRNDYIHSYRLRRGIRSGSQRFGSELGAPGRQRHGSLDPAA
jgi:hypothetical protein